MTAESKPRFLDSLIGLFRDKPGEAPPTNPNKDRDFEAQRANFDAALRDLDEKAEEHRRQRAAAFSAWCSSRTWMSDCNCCATVLRGLTKPPATG